ncbi:MAG: flagellar motor switch protein FliM [Oscillospiraceae bacterium]|nr:flagellar motor switch protein FliM [Oscillospiraceae bacterium]
MAEVLSQSEIDALLSAIHSGEMDMEATLDEGPELKIKPYDFRTAGRFSKEQIRTLTLIYENFARLFTTYLSGTLRAICQVDILGVEELKFQEFVNALPDPVILAILSQQPFDGPALLEISPDVAYALINRLLGGGGNGSSGHAEGSRNFTEIEIVLLERIVRQFIRLFGEAWEKVIAVDVSLERIETSAQFAQIVALGETVAVITLNVQIGEAEGLVNICLPYLALEPVAKQLNTKLLFQIDTERRVLTPMGNDIRQRIAHTRLPVTAEFNTTPASVRDILTLQEGDVIQLDHKVGEALVVKIGHLAKFHAAMGVRDRKYAVMISGVIREEELDRE